MKRSCGRVSGSRKYRSHQLIRGPRTGEKKDGMRSLVDAAPPFQCKRTSLSGEVRVGQE